MHQLSLFDELTLKDMKQCQKTYVSQTTAELEQQRLFQWALDTVHESLAAPYDVWLKMALRGATARYDRKLWIVAWAYGQEAYDTLIRVRSILGYDEIDIRHDLADPVETCQRIKFHDSSLQMLRLRRNIKTEDEFKADWLKPDRAKWLTKCRTDNQRQALIEMYWQQYQDFIRENPGYETYFL